MYSIARIFIPFFLIFMISGKPDCRAEKIDYPSPHELLKKADNVRAPWPDYTAIATLTSEKINELKNEKFRIFISNYAKTLVSYIEPQKRRGNLLLMVDDNLWYYVYQTQRPMRITPVQKLSGGASYGDITRLNWSGDYRPEIAGDALITINDKSYDTWFLKLNALSKSATYQSMDLYIEKGTCYPRKAVVYLQSGKKMKTMYFMEYKMMAGKIMNTKIEFIDHLSSDNLTTLMFSKVVVKKFPESFFLKTNLPFIYSDVVY